MLDTIFLEIGTLTPKNRPRYDL